jgi:uncharacterized protein
MSVNERRTIISNLAAFFILTFAFTWFFWLFGVLSSLLIINFPVPNLVWVVIGAHGPLAVSFWLTYKVSGLPAVKKLLLSGFQLRMRLVWWAVILVVPFILAGLAFWINMSSGDFNPDTTLLAQPLLIIPNFLFMFFLGGSFQEEFGWRGFALPRLLSIQTPFTASLILGVIWGFWHLPLFYIGGLSQSFMSFGIFFLLTLAFSFFFTWIYMRTDYNLFSALLLHTTLNTSLALFPPIEQVTGGNQAAFTYLTALYLIAALVLIVRERQTWFKKLPLALTKKDS